MTFVSNADRTQCTQIITKKGKEKQTEQQIYMPFQNVSMLS